MSAPSYEQFTNEDFEPTGKGKPIENGVDALSQIDDAFLSKSSKFYLVWIIR